MYDRAPRQLTNTVGSTSHVVGPGSYNVEVASKARIKMDAYAPFGSLVERNTGLVDEEQVVSVPGPGYYDGLAPPIAKGSKQGGVSLGFTSKRFQDNKEKMPGPGAYNVAKTVSEPDLKAKSAPTLRTSRVKFFRTQEAPSIPIPRQAYGYEESESGVLVKQAPPAQDGLLGPASYAVPREEINRTTKKYKGINFGKMTAKRSEFFQIDRDVPGPGAYDTAVEKRQRENLNLVHENEPAQEKPQTLRFTEEVIKNEEKQKLPGPGQYSLSRAFDPTKEKHDVEHAPFGSQTKRFSAKSEPLPGPGTYNDPRSALDSLKRVTGLKRSPFGQTALRFGVVNDETPGPAAYHAGVEGIGQVTMRKLVMESARKGAFGSTAPRGQPLIRTEDFTMPGPAEYLPKERPFAPRYQALSSMFSSMSTRFDEQHAALELPAPGAYDVARSFNKTNNRLTPKAPQSDEARKRRFAPGASAAPRTGLTRIEEQVPGPDAYDPATATGRNGVTISKSARFKSIRDEVPGPGTYSFAPGVRDSVWRPTFNITLADTARSVAPGTVGSAPTHNSKMSFLNASGQTHSRPALAAGPSVATAEQTLVAI